MAYLKNQTVKIFCFVVNICNTIFANHFFLPLNLVSSFNPILSQANESPLGTLANAVPVVATSSAANATPPSVNSTADDYPELVS